MYSSCICIKSHASSKTSFRFCASFDLDGMICMLVRPFDGLMSFAAASAPALAPPALAPAPAPTLALSSLAIIPGLGPSMKDSIMSTGDAGTLPPRKTPVPGPPGVAPAYMPPEIGFADRPLPSNLPPRPAAASGLPRPSPARANKPPPDKNPQFLVYYIQSTAYFQPVVSISRLKVGTALTESTVFGTQLTA